MFPEIPHIVELHKNGDGHDAEEDGQAQVRSHLPVWEEV